MRSERFDAEYLREILEYREDEGKFFWIEEARAGFKGSAVMHSPGEQAGTARKVDGRVVIRVKGRTYLRYRLAFLWCHGRWPKGEIDHIDGDATNDRIINLREATRSLNSQNVRVPMANKKSSVFLGVYANKPGRKAPWRSAIGVDGRQISLGSFYTEEEAHSAYLKAKRNLHEGCTI